VLRLSDNLIKRKNSCLLSSKKTKKPTTESWLDYLILSCLVLWKTKIRISLLRPWVNINLLPVKTLSSKEKKVLSSTWLTPVNLTVLRLLPKEKNPNTWKYTSPVKVSENLPFSTTPLEPLLLPPKLTVFFLPWIEILLTILWKMPHRKRETFMTHSCKKLNSYLLSNLMKEPNWPMPSSLWHSKPENSLLKRENTEMFSS